MVLAALAALLRTGHRGRGRGGPTAADALSQAPRPAGRPLALRELGRAGGTRPGGQPGVAPDRLAARRGAAPLKRPRSSPGRRRERRSPPSVEPGGSKGPTASGAAWSSAPVAARAERHSPADAYAMSFSFLSGRTFTDALAGLAFTSIVSPGRNGFGTFFRALRSAGESPWEGRPLTARGRSLFAEPACSGSLAMSD